jgi:hypothetical protein
VHSLAELVACVLALAPAAARADAIGPSPRPVACVEGAVSAIAGELTHAARSYCAPALAPDDGRCVEGHRAVIREFSIGGIPYPSGGHGGPAYPATPATTYAVVEGPCDAPEDEAPVRAPPRASVLGGPTQDVVPSGCHRLLVWIPDPAVRCPPAAPPPSAPPPSAPPPSAPPPSAPPPSAPPPSAPPPSAPPPTALGAGSLGACAAGPIGDGAAGVLALLAAAPLLSAWRRRSRV